MVGLWAKAMVTVYLCGISVIFACLIGIPLGIAAAERAHLGRVVEVVIDTLQTLPSFVYLMPVVMLFRVGDFAAMIAVAIDHPTKPGPLKSGKGSPVAVPPSARGQPTLASDAERPRIAKPPATLPRASSSRRS